MRRAVLALAMIGACMVVAQADALANEGRILRLKTLPPEDAMTLGAIVAPPSVTLIKTPRGGVLLAGPSDAIDRVERFIRRFDGRDPARRVWVRPLQHAEAHHIADLVREMAPSLKGLGQLIVDERTNRLVIVATRSAYHIIDKLVRHIDVPAAEDDVPVHIKTISDQDAEEIARTLQARRQGFGGHKKAKKRR